MNLMRIASLLLVLIAAHAAQASPPNVLLIVSDDQGWGDYGFMQHPHVRTPNLDRLARESLTFTRGYVPTSLCRPSLASMITGRYPHEHGIVGNDPPIPVVDGQTPAAVRKSEAYLAAREAYLQHIDRANPLPRRLSALGYRSLQTGKWWEGSYRRGGFDAGMTHGDPRRGGRHGDEGLRIGREGLGEIFKFIGDTRQQGVPFFVWYAPMLPHSPHNPPERLLQKYRDKTDSVHLARYWAMCEWFDETCGELLDFLEREQLAGNTLVVYVADNGWINQSDSGEFAPRSKRSPYDGGIRTPIMIRWPGTIAPKLDERTLASSIDLVPTILHAIGAEADPDLPGVDLLNTGARTERDVLFGEIFEHDAQHLSDPLPSLRYRWMIQGNWKLIVPQQRVRDGVVELFDLSNDPQETQNLATEQPQRVDEMIRRLNAWWPADAQNHP